MNEERAGGRIRAFGASNWRPERIAEANAYAAERQLAEFAASSSNLSLSRPKEPMWPGCLSISDEDRDWHTATQFPLLSWSSQGGGFLTGRYTREDTSDQDIVRVWYSDKNFARLGRATELGERRGASLLQIAMFVTPIFFTRDQLGPGFARLVDVNLLFHFVDVVRSPLLGQTPAGWTWVVVTITTIVGWGGTLWIYSRFRRRVPYWL